MDVASNSEAIRIGNAPAGSGTIRRLDELPGPRGLPFFGNAFQINPSTAVDTIEAWAREYRPFCVARFPMGMLLLVTDPALGEALVRARPHALRRWSPIELVFEELGAAGVFSLEGDAWKTQRKLVMHALSQQHLRSFFPTLRLVATRLLDSWRKAAKEERVLEPTGELMRFTSDVTVSLAFGTDMNSIERGEEGLQQHLSLIFPAIGRRLNAIVPYWRYFRLPQDRKLDRALATIRALQVDLVVAARARLAARAAEHGADAATESPPTELAPNDMLEAMLLARDEAGEPFSDEAIYGNMLTMLLAGEDTTAYGLAWAMHYLCDRPDVVARMRAEVSERFAGTGIPETYEQARALPYVDAVAQEALRLKSPAPALPLEALTDLILGDVLVPKGTAVEVMTRVPAMEDAHFADGASFRPERWIGEVPDGGAHTPSVNLPFGSGPRICPGRPLALLEMRMVLSLLVQHFDIERVGNIEDVKELTSFVLTPTGLQVRLRERIAA